MTHSQSSSSALSPEYVLLGLLDQQASHGYELHQRIKTDLNQTWRISLSQVYNILNRLEEQGFIHGELVEQEKLPNRMRFRLTKAGRQRLLQWMDAPAGPSVRAIRMEFITRMYFALHQSNDNARLLIDKQRDVVRAGLTRLEGIQKELPTDRVFDLLSLRLRMAELETVLVWLEEGHRALGL